MRVCRICLCFYICGQPVQGLTHACLFCSGLAHLASVVSLLAVPHAEFPSPAQLRTKVADRTDQRSPHAEFREKS